MILEALAVNSTSHILKEPNTGQERRIGNKTEAALLDFVNENLPGSIKSYEELR